MMLLQLPAVVRVMGRNATRPTPDR
jgi:hypothetical protein